MWAFDAGILEVGGFDATMDPISVLKEVKAVLEALLSPSKHVKRGWECENPSPLIHHYLPTTTHHLHSPTHSLAHEAFHIFSLLGVHM